MDDRPRRLGSRAAGLGQLLGGLAITLMSVGMVLGGFLLSGLDESGALPSSTSAPIVMKASTSPTTSSDSPVLAQPPIATPSPMPSATETVPPSPKASPTPALTQSPTQPTTPTQTSLPEQPCTHPASWSAYTVQAGDTVSDLAARAGITVDAFFQANCLDTSDIHAGQQLYLPVRIHPAATPRPVYPTATSTPYVCGRPAHWVLYVVRPGDTLYGLSDRFGATMEAIRRANCLIGDTLYADSRLYLPSLPPVPSMTPTIVPLPTLVPAESPTVSATPGPTVAPDVTLTSTPASDVTRTPPQTATPTPAPMHTSAPSPAPSVPATPTPGLPLQPTSTWTPSAPVTPTATQPPTSSHTPTPTQTLPPPHPGTSTHTPTPTPWTIG